ncbi:hypothetical protein A499_12161 [Niallia nealsonii AAU1]|nr:hypothetical protein A499_12161 [Niallia nealsonii AAU1]
MEQPGLARQSETPEAKLRRLKPSPTESEVYSGAGNRNKLYDNSLLYRRKFIHFGGLHAKKR